MGTEKLTKQNADLLVEFESTIDTIVETHISELTSKTYRLFKKALQSMQKDLEAHGIKGKWTT